MCQKMSSRVSTRSSLPGWKEATRKLTVKELKDLDSKVLLKRFFDPVGLLYKDAELIMHAMAVASVKSSCESILESHVSQ